MPEEKVRVEVFHIKYRCDECGIGFLRPTVQGVSIGSWQHRCPHCDTYKTLNYLSPLVAREEIDDQSHIGLAVNLKDS